MKDSDVYGLKQFLIDYPEMYIAPSRDSTTILKGNLSFKARPKDNGVEMIDSYNLQITVSNTFPKEIPKVVETGGRIPRDLEYHVFTYNNTLCLGSPLRLLKILSEYPSLVGFAEHCLVPYLYQVSCKLQYGGNFTCGELAHGSKGVINDYLDLFGLQEPDQVLHALMLLGKKPRDANKAICPCGCGLKLAKCQFRRKLNRYRITANRSWFRSHAEELRAGNKS